MSGFRRYGRKPLRYPLKVSHAMAGELQVETHDISDTGIFVRDSSLAKLVHVGEKLSARMQCDHNSFQNANLKVVRMTDDGVGLEFV